MNGEFRSIEIQRACTRSRYARSILKVDREQRGERHKANSINEKQK